MMQVRFERLMGRIYRHRQAFALAVYSTIAYVAYTLAFFLRFEFLPGRRKCSVQDAGAHALQGIAAARTRLRGAADQELDTSATAAKPNDVCPNSAVRR